MDDIKKNPFLSAYVALLVIGAGVLGFFAYKAYSGYQEATGSFDTVKRSVEGLKGKDYYPNEKNEEARKKDVKEFTDEVAKLEAQVLPYTAERTEDLTVPDLQGMIRKNIEEVRDNANLAGVAITNPEQFRLGMVGPLTIAPRKDAAAGLEYQLLGARQLADLLIEAGVTSIDDMGREELEVEKPPVVEDERASRRNRSRRNEPEKKGPTLKEDLVLERYPLHATVTGDMDSIRNVLNNLASTPEGQVFFTVRYVRVENEIKEGPEKDSGVERNLDGEEDGTSISMILGSEPIKMQIVVDAVRFLTREESKAKAEAAKEAAKQAA